MISVMVIVKAGEGGVAGTCLQFPNLFSVMCSRNVSGEMVCGLCP